VQLHEVEGVDPEVAAGPVGPGPEVVERVVLRALLDPAACAELLALLGIDDTEQRRERRREEARRDLASLELRVKLAEEELWI